MNDYNEDPDWDSLFTEWLWELMDPVTRATMEGYCGA